MRPLGAGPRGLFSGTSLSIIGSKPTKTDLCSEHNGWNSKFLSNSYEALFSFQLSIIRLNTPMKVIFWVETDVKLYLGIFYTQWIIFLLIYLSKMPHIFSTKFGKPCHSAEKTPQASTWPTSSKMSCYQTTISQTKNIQRAKKGQI